MANLYDSPAQAQFINTYVPIQFEGLYKVAEKAQASQDKGQELVDKLAAVRSLGSISDVDNKTWDNKYGNAISSTISDNIHSNYDLSDPMVLSKLASLVRMIQTDPTAVNLVNSRESLKKASAEADPRWGNAYSDIFKNYDTNSHGIYSGKTLAYQTYEEKGKEYLGEVAARRSNKPNKDGYWESSIHPADLISSATQKKAEIDTDPVMDLLAKNSLATGKIGDQYYITDPNTGQKSLSPTWKSDYSRDMLVASRMDASKGIKYEADDMGRQLRQDAYNRMIAAATLKLKEQQLERQKIVENYHERSLQQVTANKQSQICSAIERSISHITNYDDRAAEAAKLFGPGAASFITANSDLKQFSNDLSNINNQIAQGQASGKDVSSLIKQRTDLAGKIADKSRVREANRNAWNSVSNNEEQKALSGKSKIGLTADDINSLNTFDVPSFISDPWMETTFGGKSKVATIDGADIPVYIGDNSQLKLRSRLGHEDPNSVAYYESKRISAERVYKRDSHGNVIKTTETPLKEVQIGVQKALLSFSDKLASGFYNNKGFVKQGSVAKANGTSSSIQSIYYVPVDELTGDEYKYLNKLYGTKEVITKDKSYNSTTATTTPVKKSFIPVPTYKKFVSKENPIESVATDQLIIHGSGDQYYKNQNNSSTTVSTYNSDVNVE